MGREENQITNLLQNLFTSQQGENYKIITFCGFITKIENCSLNLFSCKFFRTLSNRISKIRMRFLDMQQRQCHVISREVSVFLQIINFWSYFHYFSFHFLHWNKIFISERIQWFYNSLNRNQDWMELFWISPME